MSGIELKPISDSQSGRSNFLLPLGKTVIGRGSVLGVSDKRVSRNHGVVEVSDGKIKIMSTHTNPTFYQAKGTSKLIALAKEMWQNLEHGDRISLTPEQHIYEVVIDEKPFNKDSQSLGSSFSESPIKQLPSKQQKQTDVKDQDKDGQENNREEEISKDTDENIKPNKNGSETKHSNSDEEDKEEEEEEDKTKDDGEENDAETGVSKTKRKSDTVMLPGQKEVAIPLQRERKLPEWMTSLETGQASVEEKPVTAGSTGRGRGRGRGRPKGAGTPSKSKTPTPKAKKISPISDDEGSEEDYKPAVKRTPSRGRGRPKGGGRGKGRVAAHPRGTADIEQSDEEGDEEEKFVEEEVDENKEAVPRKWGHGKTRDQASVKRRAKLAMDYSEDFMESEGVSSEEEMPVPEGDEGSDWEPESHSPRMARSSSKGKRTSGRTPGRKRTGGRRPSRRSSDDDESDMSEQEVYIPRPTKRSGRAVSTSQEMMSSLDEDIIPRKRVKKADNGKKRREVCQYGKKCFRKNPVHSEEYSHPGDSDYEEDKGDDHSNDDDDDGDNDEKADCPFGSDCYRKNKKHLQEYKHVKAPGRPKRQAAKRKATVVDGAGDDDGEPNTYDNNDSFLDDGTQETVADSPVESDWNPAEVDD